MNKIEKYQALLPQIESLISGESDPIANMANVAAALHEAFGYWWTGLSRGWTTTGFGTLSRSYRLYTHPLWSRSLWHGLATHRNRHRAQRP